MFKPGEKQGRKVAPVFKFAGFLGGGCFINKK
jgi:hypothetical protein